MLQIFQRHRDCFDFTKEPNRQESNEARQLCYERQREREQAANEYVSNILAANDNWAKDIDEDVSKLALSFQGILNKAERKAYREATEQFFSDVANALRERRVMELSPVTRYRMGRMDFLTMNVVTGLSRDEAAREYQKMKEQGFTHVQTFPIEAFPAVYTAFGYKPRAKASTPAQAQNKADSGTKGTGMGNNTTANTETPPAAQETPKVAVLQPYTPNHVGRPTEDNFVDTIADKYTIQGKADMIQEELQKTISGMTEPMAIFALFVECFNKEILKQCPNHKQALSLIDSKEMQKAYYRQFHNDLRKTYFDTESKYYELAETDIIQDNAISKYILQAEPTVKDLLLLLEPPATKKKARKGA